MLYLDKPASIENFEAFKKGNCTYFKIPSQSSPQCKHIYNIYTFDASNTLLQAFMNKTGNELEICDTKTVVDRIAFVKAEAVQLTNIGFRTVDFVAVKSENTSTEVENGKDIFCFE